MNVFRTSIPLAAAILSPLAAAQVLAPSPNNAGWIGAGRYHAFDIIVGDSPAPETAAAAKLFAKLWKPASGFEPEIRADAEDATNAWLNEAALEAGLAEPGELAALGPEEYVLRTYIPDKRSKRAGADRQMTLLGSGPALLNGVYDFFRLHARHRWYAPNVTRYGRFPVMLQEFDLRFTPAIRMRELGYFADLPQAAEFREAQRFSAEYTPGAIARGSWSALIPADKYAADHPQWFDGRRPRLESSESIAAAASEFRSLLKTPPAERNELQHAQAAAVGLTGAQTLISIGPGADDLPAQQSQLYALAMAIAQASEELRPEPPLYVHFIVRYGSDDVAAGAPHARLLAQFDLADADARRPLRTPIDPATRAMAEWLRGWSGSGERTAIISHAAESPLGLLPCAALQDDAQLFAELGLWAVFVSAGEPAARGELGFNPWRRYWLSTLLYQPDMDEAIEREGFFQFWFGAAGGTAAIALQDKIEAAAAGFDSPIVSEGGLAWLSDTLLAEALAQCDAIAATLPDNAVLQRRTAALKLPFEFVAATRAGDSEKRSALLARIAELDPGAAAQLGS